MQSWSSLTRDALCDTAYHAYALVLSRLDYCNALYVNMPDSMMQQLQMLINTAARVISGRGRFCSITDFIRDNLHWLPAKQRVHFKIATLVYKSQHGLTPSYITELIVPSSTVSCRVGQRSASGSTMIVPRHRTKFAERAFAVAGPSIWNSLPQDICDAPTLSVFRSRLKKYLFELAYFM